MSGYVSKDAEVRMTKDKAIETLIAVAICDYPLYACEACPRYMADGDCKTIANEEVEQAIQALRGGGMD